MKNNQIKLGAILGYTQLALHFVVGLVYSPVMIRLLGQNEYGLYQTVASVISVLGVLNLGFNAGYIRFFARYKSEGRQDKIPSLNGIFLVIFSVIGAIVLLCGIFLTFNLNLVFDKGLSDSEYSIARVLMLLMTFNMATFFPMSVFSTIISANEKFVILKLLSLSKTVLTPLITLPLLLMGYRSIAMVLVTVSISLGIDIVYIFYVFKVLKNRFSFKNLDVAVFKELFIYTSFIAINIIVDQVNSNMGKILLGRFSGTAAVAIYSVGYTLYTYYMTISTAVSGVFTPKIHRIVAENKDKLSLQREQLTGLFIRVGRIQFFLLALVSTGLLFFGKAFIANFWVGKTYINSYYVMMVLVFAATIPLIQNLGIEIQRAQNKHKFRSIIYLFMAIINIIITIPFCKLYGAIGATFGTAVSYIVCNSIIMNIYYHKKCNIDILSFWKSILKILPVLAIPVLLGICINRFINLASLPIFLLSVLLYICVYAVSLFFFAFDSYEKQLILSPLNRFFRRTV